LRQSYARERWVHLCRNRAVWLGFALGYPKFTCILAMGACMVGLVLYVGCGLAATHLLGPLLLPQLPLLVPLLSSLSPLLLLSPLLYPLYTHTETIGRPGDCPLWVADSRAGGGAGGGSARGDLLVQLNDALRGFKLRLNCTFYSQASTMF
jgi:hypothetical protein